ncbi:MAG: DUF7694 domain-containing protein [Terriglobia bacterium]
MKRPLLPWTKFEHNVYSIDPAQNAKMMETAMTDELLKNSRYTVNIRHLRDGWTHLSVKRNDRSPLRDWRELQRIKNEVCGLEREAVEIFPAESRLVDTSNQYFLFVLDSGKSFPLGFQERLVSDSTERARDDSSPVAQRPFSDPSPELQAELKANRKMLPQRLKQFWDERNELPEKAETGDL